MQNHDDGGVAAWHFVEASEKASTTASYRNTASRWPQIPLAAVRYIVHCVGLFCDAMEIDKDNANPTILNPSDLPSRRRESLVKKRDDGGTGLFDNLVPAYNYLSDPFDRPVSSSDSDDDSAEEIDEQEIYGSCCFSHFQFHCAFHFLIVTCLLRGG